MHEVDTYLVFVQVLWKGIRSAAYQRNPNGRRRDRRNHFTSWVEEVISFGQSLSLRVQM